MMQPSCHPKLVFTSHFLKIVVEVKASGPPHVLDLWLGASKGMLPVKVKASGPPHVLDLWLGASKGMLPVKYFCSSKSSFGVSFIFW